MSLKQPLVSLLREPADEKRAIAFGAAPDGECSRARLVADVLALAAELGSDRGLRWLVESEDPYRIAVSLLAASVVGARIALPPNLQPGTLRELRSACKRVFVDAAAPAAGATAAIDPLRPGRDARGSGRATASLEIDRTLPLVDLFTSGTSGPGKLVTKALCHLEDEVVELERGFGAGLARDAAVFATVSAHHLYGLLFRVLWPLAASRPLSRGNFLLPDDLLAGVAGVPRAIVVSSPAHLRHLAASPRLAEQAPRLCASFSSGGPLDTAVALAIEAATGLAPTEIFGSTETGGVASRRARADDPSPPWTLFEPVAISTDPDSGCLVVTSPFVTAPAGSVVAPGPAGGAGGMEQTWTMGDRVEKVGDGFRLLGRSDRVAKVGEKSLSLPEIEAALGEHDLVETATVGTYRDRSGQRLGAVVVPSAAGRRRIAEDGRRAVQGILAAHLAERWDRVALPRRWRFRDALPADARGKLASQALEAELSRPAGETLEPLLLSERRDGRESILELVVPRDLAYLEGHYDAFPLVPGAVQIHWVMSALGRILGRRVSAQRMEAIKFKNVLRPAQVFTMRLQLDDERSRVTFTLNDEGTPARVFSSGRITLSA